MIKWTSLKIYSDEYLRSLTSKKGWSKIHQTSKKENGPIGVESHTSPYIETPILCMGRLKNMLAPIKSNFLQKQDGELLEKGAIKKIDVTPDYT